MELGYTHSRKRRGGGPRGGPGGYRWKPQQNAVVTVVKTALRSLLTELIPYSIKS